jgi:hypothetical protein
MSWISYAEKTYKLYGWNAQILYKLKSNLKLNKQRYHHHIVRVLTKTSPK